MDSDLSRPSATLLKDGEGLGERSKILIIGSRGMLGQALVAEFKSDHDVIAWDREDVDIIKEQDLRFKIYDLRPQLAINAAAYTDVDGAEKNSEIASRINGDAVGQIAKICRGLDIPFVHFSTEYVFDGENKEGYKEDDEPHPISAYGRSKYLGEQELRKNCEKFYLIRLSRLFGREGAGKRSFVKMMLDLAAAKKEIEVVDEEVSLPTYAHDLAKKVRYIVENKLPYGIYHSPNSGEAVTWFGFAQEIFKITGINVKLKAVPASRFPRPAKRPKYGILLNTKFPMMRPWQEALKEFLALNS